MDEHLRIARIKLAFEIGIFCNHLTKRGSVLTEQQIAMSRGMMYPKI